MISPKAALKAAPFIGAIAAAILLYFNILTNGWSIGSVITAGLLGFGVFSCFISKPWCKIGAALIGLAFAITLGAAFDVPIFAGAGFVILFWWLR